mmetsp:Transcript_8085/g.8024  ORF Transcript_8085/g.8024 Transcript_8085/m.8024 type:complete len:346 (+) Transcript_8085:156-1193(+)
MDIFNSALKNPVPPSIKKEDEKLESEAALKRKKTSRRKHRNSHLGCGTCKKRRIKCDENLPSCLNCLKGKLHCAYLNLDSNARNALRMAQYNQHLRQDRPDNEKSPQSSSASPNEVILNTNAPQTTFTVPYPIIQTTATPVNMTQQDHVIQSPYGPLVSLQPIQQQMTNMAIPYSQVPMVQSAVPVIYSNPQPMTHIQNGHPVPLPSVSVAPPSEMNSGTPPVPQSMHMQSMHMQSMSTSMMNTMKDKDLALPPLSTIPQSNSSASLRTSPKLSVTNHSLSYNSLPSINSEYKIKQLTDNSLKNSPLLPPLKNNNNNNHNNNNTNSPPENAEESDKNPKISKLLS